jgi:hypothetical protein
MESEPTLSQATERGSDKMDTCPVCYETFDCAEVSCPSSLSPNKNACCQVATCQSCMRNWVAVCTATGTSPTCPACRSPMTDDIVARWTTAAADHSDDTGEGLAMADDDPNNRASTAAIHQEEDDGMDEFTKVWMEDRGVFPCPNCGALLEKVEGCGALMCLCGFRLCWNCKVPERECSCGDCSDLGNFYDNVGEDHVLNFEGCEGYGEEVEDDDVERCDDERYETYRCPRIAAMDELFDLKTYLEKRRQVLRESNYL